MHSLDGGSLVLDGIDECTDVEFLVESLTDKLQGSCVSLLIFSRPNVNSLYTAPWSQNTLDMNRLASNDNRLYLTRYLRRHVTNDVLPESLDMTACLDRLVPRADGMFLWARLMMTYLESPALIRRQRMQALTEISLPEGLIGMYDLAHSGL